MNAGIIRVFLVFSTIASFFALLLAFVFGSVFFGAMVHQTYPQLAGIAGLLGGLMGLAVACIFIGPTLILAGIYENTLATAKALRALNIDDRGTPAATNKDSGETLREDLPLHAGHFLFIAAVLALLGYVTYALVQRNAPKPEQTQEEQYQPN